jgi:LacI family transcriptional regulator
MTSGLFEANRNRDRDPRGRPPQSTATQRTEQTQHPETTHNGTQRNGTPPTTTTTTTTTGTHPTAIRAARPTMKDVAARAGVGLKTVSRVVNGEPGVLPDTAAVVRQAIDELGFRRNDSARQLRTGRTAGIGLVLEDVADPFYSLLNGAVEEVARAHGSLLFSASSADDPRREAELALALCSRRVDGLIVVPAAADHSYLAPELAAGLAIVFADRPPRNLAADTVLVGNAEGARSGVAHLIAHGHRRIGYIGDSTRIYTAAERLSGYRTAMAEAGAPVHESWVTIGAPDAARIRRVLDRLLDPRAEHPVTALFTGNNRLTVMVLRELADRARAPRSANGSAKSSSTVSAVSTGSTGSTADASQLALVGFDDFELADLMHPAITVVAQDPAALGRASAKLLFARLAGDTTPPRTVVLPTVLIPRGSGELPPPAH